MEPHTVSSLLPFLAAVSDPRGRRHPLRAIVGLDCCAINVRRKSYAAIAQGGLDQDIALMRQLDFTRKPPNLCDIRKVLIALTPDAFEDALRRWVESVLGGETSTRTTPLEALAVDGKTARGSFDGLDLRVAQKKTNEHKTAL